METLVPARELWGLTPVLRYRTQCDMRASSWSRLGCSRRTCEWLGAHRPCSAGMLQQCNTA